ncbi:hypothetical protein Q4512_09635 [Oceanihabitans sp. 2_MG-2023]|uniref:hypothetical protein n=1 Tax=Oceanihabitans sp. 2_MG-2023 TaxID=3062661 RepID=UPI0026E21829|nr:hypothetical protein [Oceanihabitans sp. 2_MG-2023]MDO6597173.1 hypothetical protein [Oceanihabitans sp. 2_MG-2023]
MLTDYLGFTVFSLLDSSVFAILELLVVPAITVLYFISRKEKSLFFLLFLVSYSVSDILHIIDGDNLSEVLYFACNILYVVAFFFLLLEVFKTLNYNIVLKKFLVQTIVLFVLVIYLFTVLYGIIEPILFESEVVYLVRFVEHSYNFVLLVLLSVSFLNFLENDTKKSLFLFIGCLAISFSEFLLIGYYYLSDLELLNYVAVMLNIFAFVMFYLQTNIAIDSKKKANIFA